MGQAKKRIGAGAVAGAVVLSGLTGLTSLRASAAPVTPAYWPKVKSVSVSGRTISRGVTLTTEVLNTAGGRQVVRILRADLTVPGVAINAVQAGGRAIDPADETLTSMGNRTGALGGVNGGYFDIGRSGQANGGSITYGVMKKSPPPGFDQELSVLTNGAVAIGPQPFTGTITSGTLTTPLSSVNVLADANNGGITEVTNLLAAGRQPLAHPSTIVTVGGAQVLGAQLGATSVAPAQPGQVELVASGLGGTWLATHLLKGTVAGITSQVGIGDVTNLITAAEILVRGGQLFRDPTGQPPSGTNPETAVGVSPDGRHVTMVAIDGRRGPKVALGVTPPQAAGFMQSLGVSDAVLLDGGGSTEMVARPPRGGLLAVANSPSAGRQRPVANGFFVY